MLVDVQTSTELRSKEEVVEQTKALAENWLQESYSNPFEQHVLSTKCYEYLLGAVNAHDALVAALRELLESAMGDACRENLAALVEAVPNAYPSAERMLRAYAALKLAEVNS